MRVVSIGPQPIATTFVPRPASADPAAKFLARTPLTRSREARKDANDPGEGRSRRGRHPPHARAHRARDRREERRRRRRAGGHPSPRRPSRHAPARARVRPARRRRGAGRHRHRLLPRRPRHPRGGPQPGRPRLAPAVPARGPHRRPRRRRPLHRPHRPRRHRGAVRLRPPRPRAARRARRPRPPRAPDPARLRRQEPAHRARRARQRLRRGDRRARRGHDLDRHGGPRMRHLLTIEDLDRPGIERILDRAKPFTEVSERGGQKVPPLRGRRVLNPFYEASTRPRSSFKLAAKTLSAEVINFVSSGSSVEKGESPKDTVQTLSAYRPDLIVIRTPHVGAAGLVAGWVDAAVVNAGDGKHEHPTQALLDVYTLRERLGSLDGANIWIVGDVLHSRVARSNILAFTKLGARVTVCGPPTLIPRGVEALGCNVEYRLDRLSEADVVYALRMQKERMTDSYVPSIREYASVYQIDGRRLSARQVLMHPGPVNRGVELSAEVIDSPQAVIGQQVAAGVVVRMAVLYELLAGRTAPAPAQP